MKPVLEVCHRCHAPLHMAPERAIHCATWAGLKYFLKSARIFLRYASRHAYKDADYNLFCSPTGDK